MTADGRIKILKCGSWATSAGLADFYVITTISPQFDGDFSHLSSFLLYKVCIIQVKFRVGTAKISKHLDHRSNS